MKYIIEYTYGWVKIPSAVLFGTEYKTNSYVFLRLIDVILFIQKASKFCCHSFSINIKEES